MPVTYPTTLPQRTTGNTAQQFVDDHNTVADELNAYTNVVHLKKAVGNAVTDTATWQNALNLANGTNGVHIIAPPGVYWINATLKHYSQTRIEGAGWNDGTTDSGATGVGSGVGEGTTLEWRGGALGSRRALFESANFSGTTTRANRGFRMSGIMINGRGNSTGNGMTGWWARCQIEKVWIRGWDGTSAGHGRGIICATDNVAGGTTLGGGENCYFKDLRLDTKRERFYVEAGNQQYTDGHISHVEFIKAGDTIGDGGSGANAFGDIHMLQAGGWDLGPNLHFNGAFGHCIYIKNCSRAYVHGNFLDGWGCSPAANTEYAAVWCDQLSQFNGGAGGVVIADNFWRARGHQNTTDANGSKWVAIYVSPGSPGVDQTVCISDNTGWRRNDTTGSGSARNATPGSGTTEANQVGNFVFKLDQGGTSPGLVTYTLTGNNPQWTIDGTAIASGSLPYSDANVFATPNGATRTKVVAASNSFNEGNASPTDGYWFKNVKRWADVATGQPLGWANSAAGFSGTWKTMPGGNYA